MSIMPLDQLTLESMLRNLPGIQKSRSKAKRSRDTQAQFERMGQRDSAGNYVPTQSGGLFQTVAKYNTDYGKIGNDILGGIGTDYFGRKADREELESSNQVNDQILRTVDQLKAARAGDPSYSGATEESLRGYLGLLGGPDVGDIIGNGLRVSSTKIADDGEIINIMSDASVVPTGRYADFNSRVLTAPGQEPITVGTSGAGRGRVTDLQYPGAPQATPVPRPPGQFGPLDSAPGPDASVYDRIRWAESAGNDQAGSPAGAKGPMQIMDKTARGLEQSLGLPAGSVSNDPETNYKAGSAYFDEMLQRFGDEPTALMAYNWGPGNVREWQKAGSDPAMIPKETRDYLERVRGGRLPTDPVSYALPNRDGRSMRLPTAFETAADAQRAKIEVAGELANTSAQTGAIIKGAEVDAIALGKLREQLPNLESGAITTGAAINELINHPGLDDIVGTSAVARIPDGLTARAYVNAVLAGTPAADALALHDQVKGRVFLQGFETLKGGGQITELEGQQAKEAVARVSRAQSKEAYIQAMRDFQSAVDRGVIKMRAAVASGRLNPDLMQAPAQIVMPPGFEWIPD